MITTGQNSSAAVSNDILTNTQTIFNINNSNVTKITSTNYLMWSLQVHTLLDGYDLVGYLDGSIVIHASTITTNDAISVNPEFAVWKRQDKLIYSALLRAISSSVQQILLRATTSSQIWHTFTSMYAKLSRAHIKQLKNQLKQWTKGNKSIDEYMQGLTTCMDQLAILGKALDHEDQIELSLEGLLDEYKSVMDQVKGRIHHQPSRNFMND